MAIILGLALLTISAVMISIVRSGGALKPAGVIKPAEIGMDPLLIGKQIAIRLFPDFHSAKHVIWRIEGADEALAEIPRVVLAHYRAPIMPTLHDLRGSDLDNCVENCWYLQDLKSGLPESVEQKTKSAPTAEVFIQYFDRDEKVPEACDNEKILTLDCMRPVSVRDVRRKIKTPAPYYFMQRYLTSQFYLFIEKN